MNNLFEFTENELKEVDQLVEHYGVNTRAQAMRAAIKDALWTAERGSPLGIGYTDEENVS